MPSLTIKYWKLFCVKLLGSIMRCISCIAFVYTGSLRQIKTMHSLSSEMNGLRSGMQIIQFMLLGGCTETGRLFPPQNYICAPVGIFYWCSFIFCLSSFHPMTELHTPCVGSVGLRKKITTPSDTIVERNIFFFIIMLM